MNEQTKNCKDSINCECREREADCGCDKCGTRPGELTDGREDREDDILSEEELEQVYRNATVGMQSVEILRPMSDDKGFRNVLLKEYKRYSAIAKDLEIYAEENDLDLNNPSLFAKAMMYMTTTINTVKDKSSSKLAEIMIKGINMGIISLTRVVNRLGDEGRSNIYAERMLDLLQSNLEEMKVFL